MGEYSIQNEKYLPAEPAYGGASRSSQSFNAASKAWVCTFSGKDLISRANLFVRLRTLLCNEIVERMYFVYLFVSNFIISFTKSS
jgi:hypothetical protein